MNRKSMKDLRALQVLAYLHLECGAAGKSCNIHGV